MNNEWEQYAAQPIKQSKQINVGNNNEWEQYAAQPINVSKLNKNNKRNEDDQLESLKKQHPYIYKLAELLQGNPSLEKAGNIAGHFNRAVEGTGLPSLAKGFYGTGIEAGRGLANLAPGVNIQKQEYPQLNVNPYLGEAAETIGSLGLGLPLYRGYQAAKKGIESIPHTTKIPELIRNVLVGGAVGSAVSPENRGLGAGLGAGAELIGPTLNAVKKSISKYNVSGKEKALYKAMAEHEMQKAEEESLKNIAQHQFKKNNPESLLLNAADKEALLNEANAFKKHHIGEERMLPGQQLIPEAEHRVQTTENVIKQKLGEGEPHSQKLSEHIVNAIEGNPIIIPHPKTGLPREVRAGGLREEIGRKYDELENNLPNIEIPGSPDMKAVEKELNQLTSNRSNLTDEQKESFKKALASTHPSGKNKTINGKEFFRAYRSMRKLEGDQRSKAFGLSPKEHDEWINRANETKKTYENMEDIINKHFPEGTIKRLHEINHEYSNKVAPLHENPVYQQMLKHGRYSGNLIESLSGTTKGNKILNNLIKNNPELSRLTLGHHFAENPANLLKPNKIIESYVNSNPEIARLMEQHKQAHGELQSAKQKAELYKNIEKIPQWTKEIKEQRAIANRLKHESEITGLSKSELNKRKIEHQKAKEKLNSLIKKTIGTVLGGSTLAYTLNKLRE